MPIQIQTILGYFEALGIEPVIPDGATEECGCFIECSSYQRHDGSDAALIIARSVINGNAIVIQAMEAYRLEGCRYRAALHLAMLQANRELSCARYELDEAEGAVHLVTSLPLQDSTLSRAQFSFALNEICQALERYHPVIVEAMDNGRVDMSLQWQRADESPADTPPPNPEHVRAVRDLIAAVGGHERLEEILEHILVEGNDS